MELFKNLFNFISDLGNTTTIVCTLITVISFIALEVYKSKLAKSDFKESFVSTTKGLFSEKLEERMSSAILMRRYLNYNNKEGKLKDSFKLDAINIIASLLRKEKSGLYQKTLADSLAYSQSLDFCDFQYANMQNMLLKSRNYITRSKIVNFFSRKKDLSYIVPISLKGADFFMADLSYANLQSVDANKAVFYQANLHKATFRDCDFSDVNFNDANLQGARFIRCNLKNTDFRNSIGTPDYVDCMNHCQQEKDIQNRRVVKIFISCSSELAAHNGHFKRYIKGTIGKISSAQIEILLVEIKKGQYIAKDQLSYIRSQMASSDAVIVLAFGDTYIERGVYRKYTNEEQILENIEITSPWIHAEIGIACGLGLPIMILHEKNLSEGVLHSSIQDFSVTQVNMQKYNNNFLKTIITNWILSLPAHKRMLAKKQE